MVLRATCPPFIVLMRTQIYERLGYSTLFHFFPFLLLIWMCVLFMFIVQIFISLTIEQFYFINEREGEKKLCRYTKKMKTRNKRTCICICTISDYIASNNTYKRQHKTLQYLWTTLPPSIKSVNISILDSFSFCRNIFFSNKQITSVLITYATYAIAVNTKEERLTIVYKLYTNSYTFLWFASYCYLKMLTSYN